MLKSKQQKQTQKNKSTALKCRRVKKKKKCSSRPTNSTGDCLLLRSQCLYGAHLEANCTHPGGPCQSHTPSQKRETGWGCRQKGYTLAGDYNTHANGGGVQTCPSPLHHQVGALRQSLSLSFWFLNSGSLYMALTVLELTLLQTRLASQIFLSLPPECGLKACATKPSLGQSLKGCTTKRQRR